MPVHISILGLLNIQDAGERMGICDRNFRSQINRITNWQTSGSHAFCSENFCIVRKKLTMVDFGDPRIFGIIQEYGERMYNEFDFKYKYEADD